MLVEIADYDHFVRTLGCVNDKINAKQSSTPSIQRIL